MDDEQMQRRGGEARQILNNELYKEACAVIEAKVVNELAQQDVEPKRAEHLRALLVAGRKHRQYLEQVMVSGKLATQELERKRSLADRVLQRR